VVARRARQHLLARFTGVLVVAFALAVMLAGGVLRIAASGWVVDSRCCCPTPADCDCDPDHQDGDTLNPCGNSGHATGFELAVATAPAMVRTVAFVPRAHVIVFEAAVAPASTVDRTLAKPG